MQAYFSVRLVTVKDQVIDRWKEYFHITLSHFYHVILPVLSIFIKISCLSVCLSVHLSSDILSSCRHEVSCRHVCYDDDVIKSI